MPWRNFYNDKLQTYTTTDMSEQKLEELKSQGWCEATHLQFRLASALEGYDPQLALRTLERMVNGEGGSGAS